MEYKKISFKTNRELRDKVLAKMYKSKHRYYNSYMIEVIMDYVKSGKYKNLVVRKHEIKTHDVNPTALDLTKEQYEKVEKVLDFLNRNLNEFINMLLIDFTRRS